MQPSSSKSKPADFQPGVRSADQGDGNLFWAGIEKGLKQGREQGEQIGYREGEADGLYWLIEKKLGGTAADDVRAPLEAADSDSLRLWSERILTAASQEADFR
ncbi:hypothetical protein [uncultured Thiohalocapsa sp.]|uniref:hypothetical protein n=1 Tax=uncultured Thiohalocapsa sp. TaxID=768990 RepID=UPI0025DE456D|nr:hypothetical protein [uncultured Thiohalocapsa sp.]